MDLCERARQERDKCASDAGALQCSSSETPIECIVKYPTGESKFYTCGAGESPQYLLPSSVSVKQTRMVEPDALENGV